MGRIIARLLVGALRSSTVQTAAIETTKFLARRSAAFILRRLRAGSKAFND